MLSGALCLALPLSWLSRQRAAGAGLHPHRCAAGELRGGWCWDFFLELVLDFFQWSHVWARLNPRKVHVRVWLNSTWKSHSSTHKQRDGLSSQGRGASWPSPSDRFHRWPRGSRLSRGLAGGRFWPPACCLNPNKILALPGWFTVLLAALEWLWEPPGSELQARDWFLYSDECRGEEIKQVVDYFR